MSALEDGRQRFMLPDSSTGATSSITTAENVIMREFIDMNNACELRISLSQGQDE
jgi:hypothetical protein